MRRRRILVGILVGLALVLAIGPYLVPLPGPEGVDASQLARPGGRFLEVDGTRTYIEVSGSGDGPPVVLLHGFGGSTFSWRLTAPALATAGFRVIAVDLRGFGLSAKAFEADHGHPAQARLVAAIIEELGARGATVVGHSMGGSVAAHLALTRADLVERVVLVDASIRESGGFSAGPILHLPPVARWGRIAVRALLTPDRLAEMLRSAYRDPAVVTPEVADGYAAPLRVRDWDLALLAIVRDSAGDALPATLASLIQPTLIVWGADDTWISIAEGERLREALPGSEWAVIPDSGHLPFEEQPEAFMDVLLPFLRGQP